jgi:hypothetical protein
VSLLPPRALDPPVHAQLLVERLWGWRAARVQFAHGREVILEHPCGTTVAVWNHKPLGLRVSPLEEVRLHEGLGAIALPSALDGTQRALSVAVVGGGLDAVTEPVIAVLPRRRLAIVDVRTGEAVVDIEPAVGSPDENMD